MQKIAWSLASGHWAQLSSSFDNNSKNAMFSVDDNLALYDTVHCQYIKLHDFMTIIRRCFWQHQKVLDNILENHFRDFLIKVNAAPGNVRLMADIKADPGLLNIKDSVFNLKTYSFIQ